MDLHLLKPLVALLAIVNPIGAIPFFLHFTQNLTREQRKRTVRVAAIASFTVVAMSAVCGLQIIEFFGITIASFQVGGGLLLLISSMNMLNAQQAESRGSDVGDGQAKADAGDSIAIVPLTIPLLTGPATISTMVIYADKTRTLIEHAVLVGYGVVIGVATFAAFSATRPSPARWPSRCSARASPSTTSCWSAPRVRARRRRCPPLRSSTSGCPTAAAWTCAANGASPATMRCARCLS
jgi:multiple antibiotic resistance protein